MAASSQQPPQRPPRPLTSSSPRIQYLILYNALSALLWSVVLGRVLLLVPLVGFGRVYAGVGVFVLWTQSAALLEVIHAATGLVRAPIVTTAMQVASRLALVWGVVYNFPHLATSPVYSSMLLAWSVTEVIRYSYFVCTLSGYSPAAITWLRYNTFFVLYPVGISSECYLIFKAIEPARKVRPEFAWLLQAILLIYIPGSYILFTHMITQRTKVMKGKKAQKAA